MNYEEISHQVILIAKEVGEYLLASMDSLNHDTIVAKGKMDFVTEVDKEAEVRLINELKSLITDAGFIGEEGTSTLRGDRYNWIIDPLDGTTNFIHGVQPFCISIALQEVQELVIGVIYDPIHNECFHASKGKPAFLNDKIIEVSKKTQLEDALIATGFPYTDFSRIDEYMDSLRELMTRTHGVRRLGSAAIDLAYVACGRYDAFYEYHLKPWDVAAGTVIIRQAGGEVCDFEGGDNFLFGENYVGTNGSIHEELMEIVLRYFGDSGIQEFKDS